MQNLNITSIEKKIISKKNRFNFIKQDFSEIKKIFYSKNILILGSAGSIGSSFTLYLLKNFPLTKKIFLLDKNENDLTDLNRKIVSLNKKLSVHYICSDINDFQFDSFLKKNNINILLNFAAIKHVRSEENINSINYMIKTNSLNFLPVKKNSLEKVFSVSTDKTVNPQSILGISKDLMEKKLLNFSSKYKVFISTARFPNVSFSNGSILKYSFENLILKKNFGIPSKIKRYFITHEEAVHLCLKSLLLRNNKMIVIPNPKILNKDYSIKSIVTKISKILKKKIIFVNKSSDNKTSDFSEILLTRPNTHGQKIREELFRKSEKILEDKDKTIVKAKMVTKSMNVDKYIKKLLKVNNVNKLKKVIKIRYKKFKIKKKLTFLSKTI